MINLEELRVLKNQLKDAVEQQDLNRADKLINKYQLNAKYDIEVENISAIVEFYKGNLQKAERKLLNIYKNFEFNLDVNLNLGIVYMTLGKDEEAVKYFIRSMCIDNSKFNMIMDQVENILLNGFSREKFNEIKEEIFQVFSTYQKAFPKSQNKDDYVGKIFDIKDESYGVGIYDHYFAERTGLLKDFDLKLDTMYKLELFNSKTLKTYKTKVENKKIIIPIMPIDNKAEIKVKVNGQQYTLNKGLTNRFYYYAFYLNDVVEITSNEEFIMGKIIELEEKKTESPKLILNIFIDGLSQKFIEENGLQRVMPNAYKFFKEGTICTNTYVSGEWTYVSLASFFTGMYSNHHRFYHPDFSSFSLYDKKLFSEILQDNGYFTAKIDGDWRSTPTMGYVKGIDRYLYQACVMGMHTDEVINETIEHLDTFKEKNNFIWICLPDLHDIADEFENRISVQVNNHIETRVFEKTDETSVRKGYDERKIYKYGTQLKRIDRYLGLLFNYIKDNYEEDEYIMSLIADHGQGYFVQPDRFLDDGRTKVAMMFRGKNIPKGQCDEMIQGLDLFPIILNALGIKNTNLNDGNVPKYFSGERERKYTYSESIFPKSPYRATINDLKHKFFFETKEECQVDGRFKIDGYKFQLINKETDEDETEVYGEKVQKYLQIIFEHIKEYIII
ncbi:sulfatase [Clostridiaceae bacterium 14S0207]|nr:sulfatase [Clostridiaceae bacterium 14S0207]